MTNHPAFRDYILSRKNLMTNTQISINCRAIQRTAQDAIECLEKAGADKPGPDGQNLIRYRYDCALSAVDRLESALASARQLADAYALAHKIGAWEMPGRIPCAVTFHTDRD